MYWAVNCGVCANYIYKAMIVKGGGFTGRALYFDTMQNHLSDANEFHDAEHWILYWALAQAQHHVATTVGGQGAGETAHNGAIIGHVVASSWWLRYLKQNIDHKFGASIKLRILSLERNKLEKKLGADFGVIVPCVGGKFKIALFQAKLRTANRPSIDLTRLAGSSANAPLQIKQLCDVEQALLTSAGRWPLRKGVSNVLNAAAYYLVWDRKDTKHTACFTPMAKAARSFMSPNGSFPSTGKCYTGAADFAGLVALGLAQEDSDVGVLLTRSAFDAAIQPYVKDGAGLPGTILGVEMPMREWAWSDEEWDDFMKTYGYSSLGGASSNPDQP